MKLSRRNLLKALGIESVAAASGVTIAKEAKRIDVGANSSWNDVQAAAKLMNAQAVSLQGISSEDMQWKFKDWNVNAQYKAGDIVELPDGHTYSVIK